MSIQHFYIYYIIKMPYMYYILRHLTGIKRCWKCCKYSKIECLMLDGKRQQNLKTEKLQKKNTINGATDIQNSIPLENG